MATAAIKASNPVFMTLNALTGGEYSGWGGVSNKIADAADLYARVPLVWRAGRIRCNALQAIPRYLYAAATNEPTDWTFGLGLNKLYWLTEAALLFSGHALIVKNANRFGYVSDLQWLNPFTVTVEWRGGARYFCQHINGKRYPASGWWTEDEVVYVREFSFKEDIGPGDSAAGAAMGDGQLAHYMTRMASIFFENGAMPATLITKEGGFGADTEQVTAFFQRFTSGLRNFARTLALRGAGVEVHTIQSVMKDLALPDLSDQTRKNVARAFEMPVTLLDSDETMATAKEHKRGFYDETVIPRTHMLDEELNTQLLTPLGVYVVSQENEMDLYKEDEVANSAAAKVFQDILNAARSFEEWIATIETYGIDVSEEHKRLIEASFGEREKKQAEQQALEQANLLVTKPPPPQLTAGNDANKSTERSQFKRFAQKRLKEGNHSQVANFVWEHHTEAEADEMVKAMLSTIPL